MEDTEKPTDCKECHGRDVKCSNCIELITDVYFSKACDDSETQGSLLLVVTSLTDDGVPDFTTSHKLSGKMYPQLIAKQVGEYCEYGRKVDIEGFCTFLLDKLNEALKDDDVSNRHSHIM